MEMRLSIMLDEASSHGNRLLNSTVKNIRLDPIDEELRTFSDTQIRSLKDITEKIGVDVQMLIKDTGMARVTIMQALESLHKKRLISKKSMDPKNPKSRQIFTPTDRGLAYALGFRWTSSQKHTKSYGYSILSHFESLAPGIGNAPIALSVASHILLVYECFDRSGNLIELSQKRKESFRDLATRGIIAEFLIGGGERAWEIITQHFKSSVPQHKDFQKTLEEFRNATIPV